MTVNKASLDWLSDPGVFRVNRLDVHSDHRYYETMAEAEAGGAMPWRHSLNGSWKFSYAARPEERIEPFYRTDFDCGHWDEIQVPGHIQLQGYGKPQYVNTMYPWDGLEPIRPPEIPRKHNPVGSYVKGFDLPDNMRGRPVYLSFQGVESAFYVWLNGEFIGYSEDSFTPAEFELTPHIRDGANKLAVEVYQRSTGGWLEDQDFWRFSGIFREVYLYTVPDLHVRDLRVRAELDDAYAEGRIEAELMLAEPADGSAEMEVKDAAGRKVASACGHFQEGKLHLSVPVQAPRLWSAEDPYLYRVSLSIVDGDGSVREAIVQRAGFRRFELKGGLMLLNGQRIVFRGVNRHEFNCRRGRAVTREDMLWDIRTMKRNNINAVRTSHYPNQSLWYELCDEYGIYLIDEMNLETHGSWQKMGAVEPSWNIPGNKPEWQDIVLDRARSMLERDKNHPSILIWSCGNESYAGEVLRNVARYFRAADPGRLVHYEGVFHNRAFNDTSDMESRMYAKPAEIEQYLQAQPDKPYISCEYMHAMGNSVGGMHKYTELERRYAQYQGGFIWDFIDQALVRTDRYGRERLVYGGDFGDRPTDYTFCGNGIVYADRKETAKLQEVKYLYQSVKLEPDRAGIRIVNDNLFVSTEGLLLRYVLSHEGKQMCAGELVDAAVPPQSEAFVPVDWPADWLAAAGEIDVTASLVLKQDTLWAEAGFEVAFGQAVFCNASGDSGENGLGGKNSVAGAVLEPSAQHEPAPGSHVRVVEGDVNIGVSGDGFSALFSKQVGSLVSLRYGDREMIAVPPAPLFWRAQTDNDKGTGLGFAAGAWFAASLARRCTGVHLRTDGADRAMVAFDYVFGISPQFQATIAYTVYADGSVRVRMQSRGAAGLPDLPIFAVTFKMSADYNQSEWYALGPEENYSDRSCGARLGVFSRPVCELPSRYLVPQESGNRTGVRRVSVTDSAGLGLSIAAEDYAAPLECNLSPYTAFELENADHVAELPPVNYTVVTVAGRQMGVGGDDSWGAPVHPEYRISADRELEFSFRLSPVDRGQE